MTAKFEKFLIMPLALPITPTTLVLPGTKPLYQQQQIVGGLLKWSVPEWNEAEYNRVQSKVNAISAEGIKVENFVVKVAELMSQTFPDREFSVQIGSFIVEYKAEKKKEVKK
jgi:hypothetical protein